MIPHLKNNTKSCYSNLYNFCPVALHSELNSQITCIYKQQQYNNDIQAS